MNIKKGDIVCLKSGGPEMTVEEVYPNLSSVYCHWFVKNNSCYEEFDSICLVKKNRKIVISLNQDLVFN